MRDPTKLHRLKLKRAVADLACDLQPRFHVIAELPPTTSFRVLEGALRDWDARVNRNYLGKSYFKAQNAPLRMKGMVFFERGKSRQHNHTHLLIVPPVGASDLHFQLHAKYWFQRHPDPHMQQIHRKCVAPRGTMAVIPIEDTPEDLRQVAEYVAKELEYDERAVGSWQFIQNLCRFS